MHPLFLAFFCGMFLTLLAAHFGGVSPLSAASYSHWDSGHYLKISYDGYELFKCDQSNPNSQWCGNTAWFPLYPFVLYIFGILGLSHEFVGVAVSHMFYAGILVFLWKYTLKNHRALPKALALFSAAVFPGGIYYHAVFPLSMFVFFVLLAMHLYEKNRFAYAGIASFLCAMTYPPGVWMAGVWCTSKQIWKLPRKHWAVFLLAPLGSIFGVLTVYVIQFLHVGVWGAHLLIVVKYAPTIFSPITTAIAQLKPILEMDIKHISVVEIQTFVCLTYAISLAVFYFVNSRHQPSGKSQFPMLLFLLAFTILPMTVGPGLSQFRSHAMLLPSVALMHYLPLWMQFGFLFSFTAIYVHLSILFFQGAII